MPVERWGEAQLQRPIKELASLRGKEQKWKDVLVNPGNESIRADAGVAFEMKAFIKPSADAELTFRFREGGEEHTDLAWTSVPSMLSLDTSSSGVKGFAGRFSAPFPVDHGTIRLTVLVDKSSIEVFGDEGSIVMTKVIFPKPESTVFEFTVGRGSVTVESITIAPLTSIWTPSKGPVSKS